MKMRKRFIRLNVFLLIGFIALSLFQGSTGTESLAGMVFFALLIPFIAISFLANIFLFFQFLVAKKKNREGEINATSKSFKSPE
jgi:hypothetical protein